MAVCKDCGGSILWTKQEGRWRCFNAGTQVDHWDECSKRRWAQVKATGKRFERPLESGYAKSVHGTKFDMKSSGSIRGANYKTTGFCLGCVPPWEACPIECPDALQVLTDEDLAQIRKMVLEAAAEAMTEALKAHFTEKKATSNAERQRRYRERHSNADSNVGVTLSRVKKRNADSNAKVTQKPNSTETWNAYAAAYHDRYGTDPTRNVKANSLLSQFCQRVPLAEAPLIAAFYIHHEKAVYVSSHHALTLLLRDAEGLRTEWATNRTVTDTEARQTDRTGALGNVFRDLKKERNVN